MHQEATPKKYECFHLMATWVRTLFLKDYEIGHNIYMIVEWAPPKNLGFSNENYINFMTLKVEGPNHDIFGYLPFDWGLRLVHSKFAKFVRWSHAEPWSCPMGKTSPDLDMLGKLYGLQTRKVTGGYICTWCTVGSSWDHLPKHVVPINQKNPTCFK